MRNVTLILDDGSRFHGKSFGYEKPVAGEVVFNTAMTGYPESLTDPSYAGQLMTLTYPLVGNYGVPPFTFETNGLATFMESERIHAEAIIVSDYSEEYSHWNAVESLADWLKREQVPGITGIDTRELTKVLREHGVMMGKIVFDGEQLTVDSGQLTVDNGQLTVDSYENINYVDKVSCKEIIVYANGESRSFSIDLPIAQLNCQLSTVNCQLKRVVLVDCGVKTNIIRCLLRRNVEVIRVPWDYDFNGLPVMLPYRISVKRCRIPNFLFLESVWEISYCRKRVVLRYTSSNMVIVATTSRYAWWARNVVSLPARIMVMPLITIHWVLSGSHSSLI